MNNSIINLAKLMNYSDLSSFQSKVLSDLNNIRYQNIIIKS